MTPLYVPGLGEAREREARERLAAYLDPLWEFESCGVRVVQLTPRLYLELAAAPLTAAVMGSVSLVVSPKRETTGEASRGPVGPRGPNFAGIGAMLWRLQRDFRAGDEAQRDAIFARVAAAKIRALRADLKEFIALTFADQPTASDGAKGNPSPWAWVASLVDLFAAEYAWTRATVLDSPFRCLFQEIRCIIRRRNPKAAFFNRHSDAVVNRFLQGEAGAGAPANAEN